MKPDHFKRLSIFTSALAWLLVSSLLQAAPITATVDRTEIVEGETVTLVLQTDDPQQSLTTDFSILEKDFQILDQRSETQMSIVNGQQNAVVRLMITLEPRRAGELLIPAMIFDGSATRAIRIAVQPAPELAPGEAPPVFIEMSLDPEEGPYYVHSQLALTVRIFYQQNLTEAAINPPTPQQASVRLLDEIPFQSTRNGIRYRVLERRYAIFPERSGGLTIPPLVLSGRLIERPTDRLWQPSVRGRRVEIQSEALTIPVSPKPATYPGDNWLPARRVTLSQQISDSKELKVGEPVTRTVIIDAVGLEENMLEEPAWPEMENARIYPDQPQGISRDDGQWVLGHKEFRYAVVPEAAGELVLPEIRLDWWDTTANQLRTAILPEHRVVVAASALAPDLASLRPALVANAGQPDLAGSGQANSSALLRWRIATFSALGLWLATLVYFQRRRATNQPAGEAKMAVSESETRVLADLKKACLDNDATTLRRVLGHWIRTYGPEAAQGSLIKFATDCGRSDLHEEILSFNAVGFRAQSQENWTGGADLWRAFSNWLKTREQPGRIAEATPDLYARAR